MTKISSLTALAGSTVDDAADLLPVVDMSEAGAARNKKITFDETRIALGLSSADSPQFTGINLGHASDTTITRVSAGVVAIEGVNIVTTAGAITFAADISVPDEAYDATAWNGSLEVPTKNAVRDKIEAIAGGSGASTTQTGEMIGGFIASPSDKSYTILLKAAHGGTITETTTKSVSGTCTATFKINSTALGGTANSVSSSEQSQSHASSNVFAAADDIVLTVSSNSSCADMSFTIKYTRTLD